MLQLRIVSGRWIGLVVFIVILHLLGFDVSTLPAWGIIWVMGQILRGTFRA